MIFFLSSVLLGVITLFILWWYWLSYYFFRDMRNVACPVWMLPIFGHLMYVKDPMDSYWLIHEMMLTVGKGRMCRGSIGFNFVIIVSDPEFLEHLMMHSSALSKSDVYKFLYAWLGTGLLTSTDDKWQSRRKLLTPAYHFKILEQFIDVFDKNSSILVQQLQSVGQNDRLDIYPYITLCALDTICGMDATKILQLISSDENAKCIVETAMGTSVNAQLNSESNFVKATREMKRIFNSRITSLIKIPDFTYKFTSDYRSEKKALKILHEYTKDVIVNRRKELVKQKGGERNEKDDEGIKKKIPFLDLLLQSSLNGSNLSDEDIREEVDTFMFEGHDTITAAISFCIYSISKYPLIQARLYKEQREIFEDNESRPIVYNDLQRMKYLELVIKETLRLYPSVPFIARLATDDIKYGDIIIKKGMQIFLAIYTIHRNPDIYPNPDVFDPERFTPEECAKRHSFAYLPFSAGYRNCIGQKFAMLEMKSTISKLLRNFEFTDAPNSKLKLKSEIILNSATGVHVGIRKRI